MPEKSIYYLFTLWVNSKTLPSFALDLRLQSIVAAFGKGYGHYLHAAPRLAALSLSAKSGFNC
ncbi:MAG: hypothetical protein KTR20_14690, partial [Cellvibrionaceae bacterium]|nr:hypothetical protein [Cellvibrionaceae bacterium]